ncbi:MAG TPA: cobamide remodeling phosphodiesterase CbiR [Syntrophales bacterium]|jgi:sugar phosphate isomerase/epimerase|nr:cobamide remodeling phosphodiesterase CbiR [Syntrophales bacterium]HON23408.1 cobamide remodeling phosphodiesterase CbiR [Syntrophales bacterium]HOU76950.1 cobamide remodeling phosphodiesterase CbiR [Syntrophales bacterium]HPC31719.1 cobamide remodeling phosphodiesterase CbiR [Syntrophales bacterium]HQG34935.1 cobamide remodeling phosphodiesterase CbiR [Syntrophales bacterium]
MASSDLRCLKGRFPFRLGTTSYILPDAIIPNVRFLGPLLDEVELVLFESGREDNLPSAADIATLSALGKSHDLTYNVHLPTDILLGHPDAAVRRAACATVMRFYERTRSLPPTMYCLHLEKGGNGEPAPDRVGSWLTNLLYSLENLLSAGLPRDRVAVENIDYTFRWVYPLIREFDLPICLDIGHLLIQGEDLETYLDLYGDRTIMIHLHGLEAGRDHRSLAGIPDREWRIIAAFLKDYRGGLSLEVFSREDLRRSLTRMGELL